MPTHHTIISTAYEQYADTLYNYVCRRINDSEEARDLVQDVFVRLLGYDIVSEETVKSLCFTVANNLVIDHIRRHYKRQEVYSYIYDMQEHRTVLTPDQVAAYHELEAREVGLMKQLSPATMRVYEMTHMQCMTAEEISHELGISRRTVECHQFRGRKFVCQELRKVM